MRWRRGERAALAAILIATALAAGVVAAVPSALGVDEAVYAGWARHWLDATPKGAVADHRAPGLPVLLWAVQALGFDGEAALRSVGVLAGVALVAATWALARRLGGAAVALVAAGLVATSPRVIDESARALTDVPAAAAVVALVALVVWQLSRPGGPSWWLVAAAPLAAAAFYVRYAAALPVALAAAAAVVVWWPAVRAAGAKVIAGVALLLVLVAPHLLVAIAEQGSPAGQVSGELGRGPGEELVGATPLGLADLSWELAGPVWGLAAVAGSVVAMWRLARAGRRRELTARDRAVALLLVVGWGQIALTAALYWLVPRYVLVAVALLAVAGAVEGWAWLERAAATSSGRRVVAGGVVAAGLVAYGAVATAYAVDNRREHVGGWEPLRAAAVALADHRPCTVITASGAQVAWYSGCATVGFDALDDPPDDALVLLAEDRPRQPDEAELEALRAELGEPVIAEPRRRPGGATGDVEVYALGAPFDP